MSKPLTVTEEEMKAFAKRVSERSACNSPELLVETDFAKRLIATIRARDEVIESLMELMPHIRETCGWMINPAYDKLTPDNLCGEDIYKCQIGLDCFNEKWKLLK